MSVCKQTPKRNVQRVNRSPKWKQNHLASGEGYVIPICVNQSRCHQTRKPRRSERFQGIISLPVSKLKMPGGVSNSVFKESWETAWQDRCKFIQVTEIVHVKNAVTCNHGWTFFTSIKGASFRKLTSTRWMSCSTLCH